MSCPNCLDTHDALTSACLLSVLGQVAVDRGNWDAEDVLRFLNNQLHDEDVDELWAEFLGPAVDRLEELVLTRGHNQCRPTAGEGQRRMRNPANLTPDELVKIVIGIVRILYGIEQDDGSWLYAADKEWSGGDVCEDVALLLDLYGLLPSAEMPGEDMIGVFDGKVRETPEDDPAIVCSWAADELNDYIESCDLADDTTHPLWTTVEMLRRAADAPQPQNRSEAQPGPDAG